MKLSKDKIKKAEKLDKQIDEGAKPNRKTRKFLNKVIQKMTKGDNP